MSDDPNLSELVDDDELPEEYPPDRPLGAEDPGVVPDHQVVGDTVAERSAREEPDAAPGPVVGDAVGHLLDPGEGWGPDEEADAVASEVFEHEGDATTSDVATERFDDLSPEESAMHLTDPPPLHDDDGYVDEDAP